MKIKSKLLTTGLEKQENEINKTSGKMNEKFINEQSI